jgi:hypothetical protein
MSAQTVLRILLAVVMTMLCPLPVAGQTLAQPSPLLGHSVSTAGWETLGRGSVDYRGDRVMIDDCYIRSRDTLPGAFLMTFRARSLGAEVQIWSGFGYHERNDRLPLAEIEQNGTIIASELELNSGVTDPVAGRVLVNLLSYLLSGVSR